MTDEAEELALRIRFTARQLAGLLGRSGELKMDLDSATLASLVSARDVIAGVVDIVPPEERGQVSPHLARRDLQVLSRR